MKTIVKKRKEIAKARKELDALEREEFERVELPKRRKMIGKYLKYRNSYGVGER